MGKQNQQRRAAKKRREQVSARRRPRMAREPRTGPDAAGEPPVDDLIWRAVATVAAGQPALDAACQRLAREGPPVVGAASRLLRRVLDELGQRGWSPADVDHVVTRRLSPAHAAMVAGEPPPRAVLDALRLLVEALALVVTLPEVPPAGAVDPDVAATDGLDARLVTRVRALLRKAESTEFPEEAEALTAKAQELIARHALDAVRVQSGADVGAPSSRRVHFDDPYVDPKALLLDRIAQANRSSAVYAPAFGWSTVFGYDADLDAVELLTTSLLAQAAHALARQGSRVDAAGRSRTRSFRRAFLVGFANRIGERLAEATAAQVAAAGKADDRLLPVLVARDARVDSAQAAAYPSLVSRPTAVSNGAGWVAGRAAAELADLSAGAGALDRGGTR